MVNFAFGSVQIFHVTLKIFVDVDKIRNLDLQKTGQSIIKKRNKEIVIKVVLALSKALS
jgi:hypothetical protein